jgi:two-component system, chemotaxis family, protein-glutamate methylesterase/glutaminase
MARDIIVIGGSAGGIQAAKALLHNLPPNLPAAVFLVLHISPFANTQLPKILAHTSSIKVVSPEDGETFEPGTLYVAPPNYHLRLQKTSIELDSGPKENRHRPAIDALFRSAAWEHGRRVVGVVLTGTLDDGSAGLWEIKKRRGIAVVQTPDDALYSSMPLSAIKQVHVDYIVPINKMAQLLSSLCMRESAPQKTTEDLSWESGT